jgi:hypothetical protein
VLEHAYFTKRPNLFGITEICTVASRWRAKFFSLLKLTALSSNRTNKGRNQALAFMSYSPDFSQLSFLPNVKGGW